MSGLAFATCDVPLPPGKAPDWVQLLPGSGTVTGRDGRSWELVDPAGIVLAFEANGADLPVDYEHQNDNPEARAMGPIRAAGWIKEMRADDGGVWGRVEWTATAAEMIGRKEYRYISPVLVYHEKTRQIVKLKGAGLVHTPNLYLTALASQEDAMMPPKRTDQPTAAKPGQGEMTDLATFAAMIAQLLDLPPETPPKELFAKLKEKMGAEPDPAKFVPVGAVQAMLAERNLSLATASEDRAKVKVGEALRLGHIPPAMKDWATALCRSDEASFDRFLASSAPAFSALLRPSHIAAVPPASRQDRNGSELADAICSQLGLKPGSLTE
ncbi:MAG: phage protease [Tabrizicola sp.]|jgi:phage I-like protein|nr:phage protease [Tabrizicola sp.]